MKTSLVLRRWVVCLGGLLLLVSGAPVVRAEAAMPLIIDTSLLVGQSAILAFDLVDGNSPSSHATVTGFATDGLLGASSVTGGVDGTLPGLVTLTDTEFFNEYQQIILLGTQLSFSFEVTGTNAADAGVPDSFSIFLLDVVTGAPLVTTSDPTGAGALLLFNVGSAPQGTLEIYTSPQVAVQAVPEPAIWTGLLLGVGLLAVRQRRRSVRLPSPR